MFEVDEKKISMTEGDFGLILPIELEMDDEIVAEDTFSIKIFKKINEAPIVEKTYNNIAEKIINFQLTKEESELLKVGLYYYDIDWYQENSFLNNIIAKEKFRVIEKAGE